MTADALMFCFVFFVFLKINMQSFCGDQAVTQLCSSENTDSREICFTVQTVFPSAPHSHYFTFHLSIAVWVKFYYLFPSSLCFFIALVLLQILIFPLLTMIFISCHW